MCRPSYVQQPIAALAPAGTILYWSAFRSEKFEVVLRNVFGDFAQYPISINNNPNLTHYIYVARAT